MVSLRAELAGAMKTTMYREAAEAPDCVENQLQRNAVTLAALVDRLRTHPPAAMVTIGRGSSDHAATYARYLVETRLGILTSSLSPSIFSVFKAPLSLAQHALSGDIAVGSQPGLAGGRPRRARFRSDRASPWSTIRTRRWLRSPRSQCRKAPASRRAPRRPRVSSPRFRRSRRWWRCGLVMRRCRRRYRNSLRLWRKRGRKIGRPAATSSRPPIISIRWGAGCIWRIAQEAAHKLKETCMIHAEAFSSAEVLHGPNELAGKDFPVLLFRSEDASRRERARSRATAQRAGRIGDDGRWNRSGHFACGTRPAPGACPILQIQAFYRMANALACDRGHNPDQPRHVQKVTHTV